MCSQLTKQESAREIAGECRAIYDEIRDLQKHLGWSQKQLCEAAGLVMCDDEIGIVDEKETIKKLQDQVKKMFQRKNWERNKSTEKTLAQLEQLRNAIYRTDKYRYSKLHESALPPELRKAIRRESEELHKFLRRTDYEE